MTDHTPATSADPRGFWDRPATWKAFAVVGGYLVFYLLVGQITQRVFADQIDEDDILSSASSILLGVALPIAIGALALLAFIAKVGWLSEIFGRQRVPGRRWMWIAPVLVLAAVAAHVAGTDWDYWSGEQLAAMVVVGICVGLAEELVTRGLAVKMLRDAGRTERFVAGVSSLLFALMHTANIFSGMAASVVGATVVYTFAFGMLMYLSMRLTGTIWTAIVLHGLTDPTTFLATGGLDEAVTGSADGATAVATVVTVLLIVFGFVSVFLVRGSSRAASSELP
ncbi:CPBP family intramembrane glutamic endopeptidase [Aeromicrobium choanae]|uniref:CAAX protease self-immunity n=1 Tax=Aeromicrobium choanae TaxID=1736691 RepID=A0A1T4Z9T7_9ACTN|nr:CPBP family intramembrane glutamic endopeptidase [Aeromicrobium choanae]SKB10391.1 CAAX protease self-immunity [Aeromicrobium choanae]